MLLHDAQRRGGDLLRCSICGYPEDFRGARRFRLRIHHRRPRLSIHLLAESVLALPRDAYRSALRSAADGPCGTTVAGSGLWFGSVQAPAPRSAPVPPAGPPRSASSGVVWPLSIFRSTSLPQVFSRNRFNSSASAATAVGPENSRRPPLSLEAWLRPAPPTLTLTPLRAPVRLRL